MGIGCCDVGLRLCFRRANSSRGLSVFGRWLLWCWLAALDTKGQIPREACLFFGFGCCDVGLRLCFHRADSSRGLSVFGLWLRWCWLAALLPKGGFLERSVCFAVLAAVMLACGFASEGQIPRKACLVLNFGCCGVDLRLCFRRADSCRGLSLFGRWLL